MITTNLSLYKIAVE